ncbi:hypothetical protein [Oricola cellulosilytica]|uniref:Transmembrane anchor protein n=1 Tax=Oricola cellulosilytica TaxID=1429082 RepID=A0A4R0P651_9HYPH|nr:hypothetical protein [Oricola cellulosilytica]TCD12383.1 hypothetical protein E0D97_15380 [Oricola cellulosilytica]
MYNTDLPTRAELPSSARLKRSTIIAAIVAAALLVTVVLPAEYGIDPTRIGRMLGVTEMGEIKTQLAQEAEADRRATEQAVQQTLSNPGAPVPQAASAAVEGRLSAIDQRLDAIVALLVRQQQSQGGGTPDSLSNSDAPTQADQRDAQDVATVLDETPGVPVPADPPANEWADEVSIVLAPGEGAELKLVMEADAEAEFHWTANGAVLNFDTHGDGGGQSVSYEKGRGIAEDEGVLRAAFQGNHGWFWRNRTDAPVTLTLRTRGEYRELKRTA